MRIGVFGGSFDPIHFGHLILAEQCREQARLDEVWLIPAARPPHKLHVPQSSFAHRLRMLQIAIDGQAGFRIDDLESKRSGPSFTADTLDELNRKHPNNDWYLLMGSDSLPDLPSWHDPHRVVARAGLVVMERPGWPMLTMEVLRKELNLPSSAKLDLQRVEVPLIDLASRDIRARVGSGRSIRFMVPAAVDNYIRDHKLYSNLDSTK